jgi:hypothetical protein
MLIIGGKSLLLLLRSTLVRRLVANLVFGSFHPRFCALSNCFASTADAFAHGLACGDGMSLLDVVSCRFCAASNISWCSGHGFATGDTQMRERALVQVGCHFEPLVLLIFADGRSRNRSHLSISRSGFVTFLA